jgi:alcohol dehydrogenase
MVVESFGAPLRLVGVDEPPLTAGPALTEVLACGVCFSDVKTSNGGMPWSHALALPHIPGHEICGRVLATDPAGAFEVGTNVVVHHQRPCQSCELCRSGREGLCGSPRMFAGFTTPGGFQDRLVAPLDQLFVVPPNIDPVHAAPLTCALGTAFRAVVTRGGAALGRRMVVIGLGGVGIHALQIAAAAGAAVVGLDVSAAAVERARGLGLDAGLDHDGLADRLGGPADVVIDAVGTERTIRLAAEILGPAGRLVLIGYSQSADLVLPTGAIVAGELEILGSRYVTRGELERAIRLAGSGAVTMIVDRVLCLEDANEAFAALRRGDVVGRVVLDLTASS